MGVDVGAGGELLDYGLGGARWQRSRPSIIQLMIPMVAPPVKILILTIRIVGRPGQSSVLMGSTDERRTRLRLDFSGILRFRRQLKHRCFLAGGQDRQEHYLAVGKFQGVMMSGDSPLVDLPKDRSLVMNDLVAPCKQGSRRAANFAGKRQLGPGQYADCYIVIL